MKKIHCYIFIDCVLMLFKLAQEVILNEGCQGGGCVMLYGITELCWISCHTILPAAVTMESRLTLELRHKELFIPSLGRGKSLA